MFSSGRTAFFGYLTIPEKLWVLSLREGDGELTKHVGRSCLEKKHACSSPSSWHLITSCTYEHWELSAFRSGRTQLQRPRSMGRNSESGLTTRAQLWTLIARESQERVHT